MIGLGKVWRAVTGTGERQPPPLSTIPRDITAPRPNPEAPAWEPPVAAPSETRTAERFVPFQTATVLTTTGGKRLSARIINVSRTGVALEPELAGVNPRDIAAVGTRAVTPGRRISLGLVLLFKKPLDAKVCTPDIIL